MKNNIHGFFTSRGGVSDGQYASLNCSFTTKDDPARIQQNINRVCHALHQPACSLRYLTQIHSANVFDAHKTPHGAQGDGLISSDPDFMVSISTADCLPILLSSQSGDIVGAVHGGWRGLARHIIENAVNLMHKKGAQKEHIRAVIGPCIGKNHYEIDHSLYQTLYTAHPDISQFMRPSSRPSHYFFDLTSWCMHLLRKSGVRHISCLDIDTYPRQNHCFSHRYATHHDQLPTGRQISVIAPRRLK